MEKKEWKYEIAITFWIWLGKPSSQIKHYDLQDQEVEKLTVIDAVLNGDKYCFMLEKASIS